MHCLIKSMFTRDTFVFGETLPQLHRGEEVAFFTSFTSSHKLHKCLGHTDGRGVTVNVNQLVQTKAYDAREI
jgi:hypothetical protein